jgi:hypothetical protein
MLAEPLTRDQVDALREAKRDELGAWMHYQTYQKSPTHSFEEKESAYQSWWAAQANLIEIRDGAQKR